MALWRQIAAVARYVTDKLMPLQRKLSRQSKRVRSHGLKIYSHASFRCSQTTY